MGKNEHITETSTDEKCETETMEKESVSEKEVKEAVEKGDTENVTTSKEKPMDEVVNKGDTESVSTSKEKPIYEAANKGDTESMTTSKEKPVDDIKSKDEAPIIEKQHDTGQMLETAEMSDSGFIKASDNLVSNDKLDDDKSSVILAVDKKDNILADEAEKIYLEQSKSEEKVESTAYSEIKTKENKNDRTELSVDETKEEYSQINTEIKDGNEKEDLKNIKDDDRKVCRCLYQQKMEH